MRLTIFVSNCDISPWWAGLAYKDFLRDGGIYIVMPFNWVYRWIRAFYYWVKYPLKPSHEEKMDSLKAENARLLERNVELLGRLEAAIDEAKRIRMESRKKNRVVLDEARKIRAEIKRKLK